MDDSTITIVEWPQGYFLTVSLLVGVSITLLAFCLAHLRRAPVPAAAGGLGSLLVGLTWGIYLGHDLAVRNAEQPASVFSLMDRHPSVLLWTQLVGVASVSLAVVLALRALVTFQKRAGGGR